MILENPLAIKSYYAIAEIKRTYLQDERAMSVGVSFGKDSSVVLDLVIKALLEIPVAQRIKTVHIVFSDTMIEMEPVMVFINSQIIRLLRYIEENKLPIKFHRAEPELKNTFWSLTIGKGYTLPRPDNRWCTDRMKVKPQEKVMLETFTNVTVTDSLFDDEEAVEKMVGAIDYIGVIGARKEESADRKARLEKNNVVGSIIEIDGRTTLAPIQDWTVDDVWGYLYSRTEPWCDGPGLALIYSQSSGSGENECNTLIHGRDAAESPGCSMSGRFGCMFCPLFKDDKALNNLLSHYPYLQPIKEARDWLTQFAHGSWEVRDLYNHREHKLLFYRLDNHRNGQVMPGGFSLDMRRNILYRILEAESRVREYPGMENYRLTSDAELKYIQQCWFKEGDILFTAFEIAAEYGRAIEVNEEYSELAVFAGFFKILLKNKTGWAYAPKWLPHGILGSYHLDRFVVQLSIQLKEEVKDEWKRYMAALLHIESPFHPLALQTVKTLPIKDMYFPSAKGEIAVRWEHDADRLDYISFAALFNRERSIEEKKFGLFVDEFSTKSSPEEWFAGKSKEFQKLYQTEFMALTGLENGEVDHDDWLNSPDISLEEKMRILDNWY